MSGSGPGRRQDPRRLGDSLARVVAGEGPKTLLGEVQTAWSSSCGGAIAAASEPVSERDGVVTVACESGAWAQELELMHELLLSRIGAAVGENRVARLRFTADLSRHR